MAKAPTDNAQEFQVRSGVPPVGPAGIRGVNSEVDPGALDPSELQRGDNVRRYGKGLLTRPGQIEVINLGLGLGNSDNQILFMGEAPVDNPRVRLWASCRGCFGQNIGTGGTILHLDPSETPQVQNYSSFFTSTDFQLPMGRFGDSLFLGDRSELRAVVLSTSHPGVKAQRALLSPSQTPVASFPGFTIRCLIEFDSKLFIGLENNTTIGASKIAVWNGLSIRDDLTGIRPPLNFALFQDKLVAGFDATAANIRVRAAGAAPGTWTTFALAGLICAAQGNAMVEMKQYLFIASGTNLIHRFDGAAVTLVRTIAGCAVDGFGCTALTLHNGLLYYGWNTPSAAYASSIGRHDLESTGANEWVDAYKDVTTEQPNFIQLSSMLSYRQQILMGGRQVAILGTKENDVKGTLEAYNSTGAPGAGFTVDQLLRFP